MLHFVALYLLTEALGAAAKAPSKSDIIKNKLLLLSFLQDKFGYIPHQNFLEVTEVTDLVTIGTSPHN